MMEHDGHKPWDLPLLLSMMSMLICVCPSCYHGLGVVNVAVVLVCDCGGVVHLPQGYNVHEPLPMFQ